MNIRFLILLLRKIDNKLPHPIRVYIRFLAHKIDELERIQLWANVFYALVTLVKVATVVITAGSINLVLNQVQTLWTQFPQLFESTTNRIGCSAVVVILGIMFFQLRKHYKLVYATLEMGVAAGTAYNAAAKLYTAHDNNAALLTLLGSIYIAVRACDNYEKWIIEQKLKLSSAGVASSVARLFSVLF